MNVAGLSVCSGNRHTSVDLKTGLVDGLDVELNEEVCIRDVSHSHIQSDLYINPSDLI